MYYSEDRRCSRLPTHITAKQYGIDCPEKGQGYGNRTKQATSALLFGKEVTLQTYGLDKYKRTLADVILPDGTNVNHALVRAGWCWWYRKYAPGNRELERLEKHARARSKGCGLIRRMCRQGSGGREPGSMDSSLTQGMEQAALY
jgi:hypothetical protein